MKARILIPMALYLSMSLGFTEESAEIKPDDPRWPLIEFWATTSKSESSRPKVVLNSEELKRSRALIDLPSDPLSRESFILRYQKHSVRIDGDWAIVYEVDENNLLKHSPRVVHRENSKWAYSIFSMVAIEEAFRKPSLFQKKEWRDRFSKSYIIGVDDITLVRLSKWLDKNVKRVPAE